MGVEESLPGRLTFSIRRRFDAVCFQDISDRPVGNAMSQICQGALDTVIAPGGILLRHSQHEFNDLACGRWASRGFPVLAVVPVSGDELAMPAEDGIRSDDGGKLVEQLAAEDLAFDGEPTALAIVEEYSFLSELLPEYVILSEEVLDGSCFILHLIPHLRSKITTQERIPVPLSAVSARY